jgi:hypothetical protein
LGTIITKKGIKLITKLLASKQQLVFTRAAVGTGSIPPDCDPADMTDLVHYKMDGDIANYSVDGDEAIILFQISSSNVESGFVITEAGLFADDIDEGEILYAYLDLTEDPQYVYAKEDTVQKFIEIEFKTVVGEMETITVITSPTALITREVLDNELSAIINPEFDDSGVVDSIKSFPDFLDTFKSKMNLFRFLRNLKAGLQFVLHREQVVDNCETEAEDLPLSAKQGKVLMDMFAKPVNAVIPASGWSSVAPFANRVAVAGVSARDNVDITFIPAQGATNAQNIAAWEGYVNINYSVTEDGAIVFYALEEKPGVNIAVAVKGMARR